MRSFRVLVVALLFFATPSFAAKKKAKKKPPPPVTTPTDSSGTAPSTATPAPRPASVEVAVVEVAAGVAYLQPGMSAGVGRGSKVSIEGQAFVVVSSTSAYAMLEIGDAKVREKAKGIATTVDEAEERPKELPAPTPPSAFAGIWPSWRAPALDQHPKSVPLGVPDRTRKFDMTATLNAGAILPLGARGAGFVRGELGMRLHAEPFRAPVRFDADASLLGWFGPGMSSRAGDSARPIVRVRELQIGVGNPYAWFGGVGRIRYAASTLGSLDGLRLQAPVANGLTVSAFGGLLPDPVNGAPAVDAQRFGVEAAYARPDLPLRPEGALVLHGSTYRGDLDERRAALLFGIFPGRSRVGAHAELSSFDSDNAWGLSAIELTAAGLDASYRTGSFQIGARVDARQQERSKYLASYFPLGWFCRTAPPATGAPAGASDLCVGNGSNTYYLASADTGLSFERFAFTVGATAMRSPTDGLAANQLGGFANARLLKLMRRFRFDATVTGSSGTYVDLYSWSAGPGVSLFADRLDASIYFRQGFLSYRADSDTLVQHAVGLSSTILPGRELLFALQTEATLGGDLDAFYAFLTTIYRPRL